MHSNHKRLDKDLYISVNSKFCLLDNLDLWHILGKYTLQRHLQLYTDHLHCRVRVYMDLPVIHLTFLDIRRMDHQQTAVDSCKLDYDL